MKSIKLIVLSTLILVLVSSSFSAYLTPHLKKCPQWKSSWCWAGAAQACLTYYGIGQDSVTNQDCAHIITTANKPQPMRVITTIINKYLPGYAKSPKKDLRSEADFKREADNHAPFACFYPGHFTTYAGYEGNKHLVMNPWPWGKDSTTKGKWEENLTYNYIANKTSSYVRTKGSPPTDLKKLNNLKIDNKTLTVIHSLNKKKINVYLPEVLSTLGKLVLYSPSGKAIHTKNIRDDVKSIDLDMNSISVGRGVYILKYSTQVTNQHFKARLVL